jgi:ABC-type nickel/cobalt efflux system permease component RcnA
MNKSLFFALLLGFALGLKHATEADHLVAVTTIVTEQRSVLRSAAVGLLWGIGHTVSLLVAGALVIFLNVEIPPAVAQLLELLVALMIVFLGSRILYLLLRDNRRLHTHRHVHGDVAHVHVHFHDPAEAHAAPSSSAVAHHHSGFNAWKSMIVGMIHGLAGSAALTLLVLTEVVRGGSRTLGFAYLFVFGLGSIGGMLSMSTLISLPLVFSARRFERFARPIQFAVALMSITFGAFYAWRSF